MQEIRCKHLTEIEVVEVVLQLIQDFPVNNAQDQVFQIALMDTIKQRYLLAQKGKDKEEALLPLCDN